jgi:hypothetical protein
MARWIRRNEIVDGWSQVRTEDIDQGASRPPFTFNSPYSGREIKERLGKLPWVWHRPTLWGLQGPRMGPGRAA